MNLETSTWAYGFGFATFATAALVLLFEAFLPPFDDTFASRALPLLFD
jgi:hypothetical protein